MPKLEQLVVPLVIIASLLSILASLGLIQPAAIIGPTDYSFDLEWDHDGDPNLPPDLLYFSTVTSDQGTRLTKKAYDLSAGEIPELETDLNIVFNSNETGNTGQLWITINSVRIFWIIESGPSGSKSVGDELINTPVDVRMDLGTDNTYHFTSMNTSFPSPVYEEGDVFLLYMVINGGVVHYVEGGVIRHTWNLGSFRISDYRADLTGEAGPGPNIDPIAVIETNRNVGNAPLWISFESINSYDPDGALVEARWDYGDGETFTEPWVEPWGSHPNHEYTIPGVYDATLTVVDDEGGTGSAIRQIFVDTTPPPGPTPDPVDGPTVTITANPSTGAAPLQVQFSGSATPATGTLISSWSWSFDDGSTSLIQNPLHEFTTNGTYNVVLTVTDSEGNQGSASVEIIVGDGAPVGFDWTIFIVIFAIGVGIGVGVFFAMGGGLVGLIFWLIISGISAFIGWIITAGLWVFT